MTDCNKTPKIANRKALVNYFKRNLKQSADLAGRMRDWMNNTKFSEVRQNVTPMITNLIGILEITEPFVDRFRKTGEFGNVILEHELYSYDTFVESMRNVPRKDYHDDVLVKRARNLFGAARCCPKPPEWARGVKLSEGEFNNILFTVVNNIYGKVKTIDDARYGKPGSENPSVQEADAGTDLRVIIRDVFIRIIIAGEYDLLYPFSYAIYGLTKTAGIFSVNPKHFELLNGEDHFTI